VIAEVTRRVWDAYARRCPHDDQHAMRGPMQRDRVRTIVNRCVGTVLDVGGGDGYVAAKVRERGYFVKVLDISPIRVLRCWNEYRIPAESGDACDIKYPDASWDTVILGETLEHLENPGVALAEACRVARKRVVVSLPLNGWCDPTHEWRIRLDTVTDPDEPDPTKREQIVLTLERGKCWPEDYWQRDPAWAALYGAD
jgi:ubiquinone/menaquinone biosynthesis C-methylase UbiE